MTKEELKALEEQIEVLSNKAKTVRRLNATIENCEYALKLVESVSSTSNAEVKFSEGSFTKSFMYADKDMLLDAIRVGTANTLNKARETLAEI
jgi:prefoldin subunit 5